LRLLAQQFLDLIGMDMAFDKIAGNRCAGNGFQILRHLQPALDRFHIVGLRHLHGKAVLAQMFCPVDAGQADGRHVDLDGRQ